MVRDDLRSALAVISFNLAAASVAMAQSPQPSLIFNQVLRPADTEMIQDGTIRDTQFGRAVAVRDNLAALGIPGFNDPDGPAHPLSPVGRVGLWTFGGTGWQRTGSIDPPAGLATEVFGLRVALGPSRAFVVSIPDRIDVFGRNGNLWVHEQRLASGLGDAARVLALAFDAGWLVVKFAGVAGIQVYARRNGTWQRVQTIEGPPPTFPGIGPAVAIADGTLVVGAPNRTSAGAALVYRLNSSGVWTLRQELAPPDPVGSGEFGMSVATDNGLIAVGATGADRLAAPVCGTQGASGAAYLYAPSGVQWVLTQKLSHQDAGCHLNHGMEIAITPTHVAVRSDTIHTEYRASTALYRRNGAMYELVGENAGPFHADPDIEGTIALNTAWLLAGIQSDLASGRVEAYQLADQEP